MKTAPETLPSNVVVFLRDNVPRSLTSRRRDYYEEAFQAHGFATRFVPVLATTTSSPSSSALQAVLSTRESDFCGLIVTSARGIAAFAATVRVSGPTTTTHTAWLTKPIWVVGAATAAAARDAGFTDIRGETSGDAERLADMLIADDDNDDEAPRLAEEEGTSQNHRPLVRNRNTTTISPQCGGWLFLAGDKARDMLPSKLRAAGVSFEQHEAYTTCGSPTLALDLATCFTTLPPPPMTSGGCWPPVIWVVFFSPSGVDLALPELRKQQQQQQQEGPAGAGPVLRWASIGPTTSSRLLDFGEKVAAEARKPCAEEMLTAILHFTSINSVEHQDNSGGPPVSAL
ncbi:hypothetical protein HDU86_002489 [Geranomyces michiganensis]|nr:hypothetical protein HDU86_002489 [Geranomyces michiganensis]